MPHSTAQQTSAEDSSGVEHSRVENSRLDSTVSHTQAAPEPSLRGFSLRPSPFVGTVIGKRYCVEGFLGEGGTAVVYLARDTHTDTLVVIKRMRPEIAHTEELRARFVLEAKALAVVDHPGVVRVHDIKEPDDEPPFLALEALRGETLGDYLKREESVPMDLAVFLTRQAAQALASVHAAGVVHRDIKPDNLFLVGDIGRPQSLKVLDFGMARLSDEIYDENSTSILGTVQYMAPEQILVEPVDARTDGYALGVVLFRMLTGHLPFEAQSKNDLLRHQLFSPVPPVSWLEEDIPPALEHIIHRATRKAPSARFPSMEDFAQALDALSELSELEQVPNSAHLSSHVPDSRDDIYEPVSARGKHVASVLAAEFGIYSRPHSPLPPAFDADS
jgi:eukaryotic-like serine/threonine-protein kinase